MNSNGPAAKTIGAELLVIAVCAALVFWYARSFNRPMPVPPPSPPRPITKTPDIVVKEGKPLTDLLGAIKLRPETDLIVFVIDTSSSMSDDTEQLKADIRKTVASQKGKKFEIVAFNETALMVAAPTRDAMDLENHLKGLADVGGSENSLRALVTAAVSAPPQFKYPAIILMTDAAPNDGKIGSSSRVTIDEAASALNTANAELHIFAAFDQAEATSGGSAVDCPAYEQLVTMTNHQGQIHILKRN